MVSENLYLNKSDIPRELYRVNISHEYLNETQ